ncbi:hypothetical protein [Streptoalloteichus hindustanus]|uniref:Uncharacterized protein n=1 Tax=Streptoalloteichus hindustanus TaxID=2017 RepID=A0A1M4Z2R6_STRHI|nr:hypothetical protein [Streptoalloteichus hindustanus]SHF12087.1 hypothetical protein SAMN05444320_102573 [Streptoalloteichus hindustanus]
MNPTRQDLRTEPAHHDGDHHDGDHHDGDHHGARPAGGDLHDAVDLLHRALALVRAHADQWDPLGAASVVAVEAAAQVVAVHTGAGRGNGTAPGATGSRSRRTDEIQRAVDSARAAVVATTFALREAADEERRRRQAAPPGA